MNQSECIQCTDYLHIYDFEGRHVCPVCFSYAEHKKDAACELLEEIKKAITRPDNPLLAKIDKVLKMRNY